MRIFAIIAQAPLNVEALGAKVAEVYPDNHMSIASNAWLIGAQQTAQEVCQALSITPSAAYGGGVVFAIESYFGHGPVTLWDWLKTKWEQPAVG